MACIRWLLGLQSAQPVRKVFIPMSPRSEYCSYIVYCSRRLCFTMPGDDKVFMLILRPEGDCFGQTTQEIVLDTSTFLIAIWLWKQRMIGGWFVPVDAV